MPTDLALHIQETRAIDTHEHVRKEPDWVVDGPRDVLADLFQNYVHADLVSAGATVEAVQRLTDGSNPDVEGRFEVVRDAWEAIQLTGYGEGVRTLAREVYGMDEITPAACRAAQPKLDQLRRPGQRLGLLRERAGLDHIQVDDFVWACLPDDSGPDFFLYDLSFAAFCSGLHWDGFGQGKSTVEQLAVETGVTITGPATLRQGIEALFGRYGPCAIAVKAQHAYVRTLYWVERSDGDAERALETLMRNPQSPQEADLLCLGDWCWARGVELATLHNLPFKLHTGYYAGTSRMPVDTIKAGNLCALLKRYPQARFVLMHIAYPYSHELVALAKHYPNVWADLCWAWAIDPYSSADFVRRFIHAAPANKLFAFGGDTGWPTSAYAYSVQMRRWLTRALEAEVADGLLTEAQAMSAATRLLRGNQLACFDLEGTRRAIQNAMAAAPA